MHKREDKYFDYRPCKEWLLSLETKSEKFRNEKAHSLSSGPWHLRLEKDGKKHLLSMAGEWNPDLAAWS
jgi:hypothetical protein